MCHEDSMYPIQGGAHLQEQDHSIMVQNGVLPLFVVMPETSPAPAVVIIHDIYGAGPFYQDLALRLANAGYIAALPDFFFRQGPMPKDDKQAARERGARVNQTEALGDLQATLTWLRDHTSGNGRVATIGMCWGGTMVLLGASREPTPDASVCYYGFPVRPRTPTSTILPIDSQEIDGIDSALLGFWGEEDHAVGIDNVRKYDATLGQYQIPHEFVTYPDAGHGFLSFDPDDDAALISEDAWTRTLAFFEEHLRAGSTT